MPDGAAPLALDRIVERYIAIRDRKSELKKEYDGKIAVLDDALKQIEAVLHRHLNEHGVESSRTAAGTFFKARKTAAKVEDWQALLEFVQKEGAWSMLTRSVSKDAVAAFREERGDNPPGVGWTEIVEVSVRR